MMKIINLAHDQAQAVLARLYLILAAFIQV